MSADYNTAAKKAAETLIEYGVNSAPISPLTILEKMDNVIVTSYSEMCEDPGVDPFDLKRLFGKCHGAMTSVHSANGKTWYVVAYNNILPFTMVQHALARELGHIVLKHESDGPESSAEAVCFAQHLLCPRPLIHTLQTTGMRLTTDILANLTGVFHQCLTCMRHTPGTSVPASINRFVSRQFMPFIINFCEYYATAVPADGSAEADFGSFMDLYEE